ncbi:serine/threonine protein kinase [Streptomyces sp. NPDC085529]|uniref:serine/threonine protein kinase n=1 Tax=Streptomyces sp. NPDC085529 TaxID=3365729 RepID=UPI0037D5114D
MLPAPLNGEFTAVRTLGGGGGEADLFVGRDARDRTRVVKLYRRDIRADRQVWGRLGDLAHPSLMRIDRTGTTADDRDFEIMPYLRGGTAAARMPMRAGDLVHVVQRLVGGINQLHALGIVHRDIKPANMLFVDAGPQIVLADYGISRLLERARMTVAFTPGFAPPEEEVTPAYDWWSLGMSVLLLATGAEPFHGMTAPAIQRQVREADMDLSRVPTRLQPLCRGLLQRDPGARWGSAQVLDWVDGEVTAPAPAAPPPAPTRRETPPPVVGPPNKQARSEPAPGATAVLVFDSKEYDEPAALARGLVGRPGIAAHTYFPVKGGTGELDALLAWLPGAPDTLRKELRGDRSRWYKLNRLLLWLDPTGLPAMADVPLDRAALERICLEAADGRAQAIGAVRQMFDDELLTLFARFDRLKELRGVAVQWNRLVRQWEKEAAKAGAPPTVRTARHCAALPLLLLGSLPAHSARRALEARAAAETAPARAELWYQALMDGAGGPVGASGLVVRAVCAPLVKPRPPETPRPPAKKTPPKPPSRPRTPPEPPAQAPAEPPAQAPAPAPAPPQATWQKEHQGHLEALRSGAELVFGGKEYATAAQMAETIREDWASLVQGFLVDEEGTLGERELDCAWELLREWAARTLGVRDAKRPVWDAEFDRLFRLPKQPDLALLRLLHRFDPHGQPVLRGRPVTVPELIEACAAVVTGEAGPSHPDRTHVLAVAGPGVLKALAAFPDLLVLRKARARLGRMEQLFASYPDTKKLRQVAPNEVFRVSRQAAMLLAAIGDDAADARLKALADRAPRSHEEPVLGLLAHMGGPDSRGGMAVRAVYTRRAVRAYQRWQAECQAWQRAGGPGSGRPRPHKPQLPPPDSAMSRMLSGFRSWLAAVDDDG